MAVQATQNLSKNAISVPSYPSDIEKVVGVSNLLLIDILANISAFFYELYQKGSKLFENFSTDFSYEANRYSVNIKQSISEKIIKLDLFHFSKEDDKKDMKKVVGKVNLLMIDGVSYIAAFFKVLSHRFLHAKFLKAMKFTAIKFSYNSKMKIYCRLSNKEVKFEPISYPNDLEKEGVDFRVESIENSNNKKENKSIKREDPKDNLKTNVVAIEEKAPDEIATIEEEEISEENKLKKVSAKKSIFLLYKIAIATLFFGYFVMFLYLSSDSQEKGFRRSGRIIYKMICIPPCYLKEEGIEILGYNKELNCYYVEIRSYC